MKPSRILIFPLLVILGSSCSSEHKGSEKVNVGVVLSLSGPVGSYGRECLSGFKLGIETSSLKDTIKLIVVDDKGEKSEVVKLMTMLIEKKQVSCLVGSVASTNTLAGAKVAQQLQTPLLVPISTNSDITLSGNFVSRTCINDRFQGKVLAKFALTDLQKTRAVIVTDKSLYYSRELSDVFRTEFEALGGTIAGEDFYGSGDSDFSSLISAVKKLVPDVIFIPGLYPEVSALLKQSQGHWDGVPKLGGDSWKSPRLFELAGSAASGNYICSHFTADYSNLTHQKFVKMYKTVNNEKPPGAVACLGYDAALVLVNAIEAVDGEITRQKISKSIRKTKNFPTVSGVISMDQNGDPVKDGIILKNHIQRISIRN